MEAISCAFRGRSNGNWFESEHHQKLELRRDSVSNSITSVTKDSYIVEIYGSKENF